MILPVTEAIVNELLQQLNKQDSIRIKKNSLQSQQSNNNNYQQLNHNHENKQNSIKETENNKYSNLILMTTKNDKVTTINIKEDSNESIPLTNDDIESSEIPKEDERAKTLRLAFFLSIAYASNIGGTGTLTGTGANLVLQGIMDEYYPNLNDLSFGNLINLINL